MKKELHAVTGAFGYTGKYIAEQLLNDGYEVRTLTNSRIEPNLFHDQIDVVPLSFNNQERLIDNLRGVKVLYNTYWVRFNHDRFSHAQAVENSKKLFDAALTAGVERVVHVSITNPSIHSSFEYFQGKGELESYLKNTGISHAILRPAVFFGKEDILINNIAWMLRRFPVYGLFGDGGYGIQPIYIEDFAKLAVDVGRKSENVTLDAIGPESFTFRELVETLGNIIDCPRRIVSIPPFLGVAAGKFIGGIVRDVVITKEEIGGLMAGLLCVDSPPLGSTKLTDWAREHCQDLGRHYASELARRKSE